MKRSKRAFTVQTKKILWTDETRMEKIMADELNWLVIQSIPVKNGGGVMA